MRKQKFFTTARICRAGVIGALYVALNYAFGSLAQMGYLQIRPAEALCIMPLFFVEAVPALFIGCILSNLTSPFLFYDVVFGSLATLVSALGSYLVGRFIKNDFLKFFLGGLFPVLVNAFVIPYIIVFLCGVGTTGWTAYFTFFLSMLITQSVWVYGLGAPLYLFFKKEKNRNSSQ